MIQIKRISTRDKQHYNYMEQLLTKSFPIEEYRDLTELRKYTDIIPNFYCNLILEETNPIGILTYWELGMFYYVEHFAIDPNLRNGGYGHQLLEFLSGFLKKPIVLEVEQPTEEMAKRRINFYQREGYTLWSKSYFQPPYRPEHNKLPMHLMVCGNLDMDKHFEEVKNRIYNDVYGVK